MPRWVIGELSWRRLVRSLLLIYGLFAIYIYFRADSMIFLPPASSYQDNEDILKLAVTDQEQIAAIYLPNPSAEYTLLYIHGNAEDLGYIRPSLVELQTAGFNVFAYDYRGYGTSDGKPSERRAYQDAETAYRYLTEQLHIPPDRIVLYGRSVGGGSAVYLATRYAIAGLILESTFTSIFRVVLPFPVLPFDKFPNRRRLRHVNCPVLILHGTQDNTIPFKQAQQLYDTLDQPKQAFWVDGADHNDLRWVAGDRYLPTLTDFIQLVKAQDSH